MFVIVVVGFCGGSVGDDGGCLDFFLLALSSSNFDLQFVSVDLLMEILQATWDLGYIG